MPFTYVRRVRFPYRVPISGLKVFMDARDTVTVEEGDRYPLGPPDYAGIAQLVEQQTENLCVTSSILVTGTSSATPVAVNLDIGSSV